MAGPPLQPTWEGYIGSTSDALVLYESSFQGRVSHVPRRPHDRERQDIIRSGSVFIYEEHASGIKRWTDGISWSPSRILGNFLIYRELEKPFPPGEKKRALKKKKSPSGGVAKNDRSTRGSVSDYPVGGSFDAGSRDAERALVGSLVDSYPFKQDGLVKKTISILFRGVAHHLVSYYNVEDVARGRLRTPTKDPAMIGIVPRLELLSEQHFRSPIDEVEYSQDGNPNFLAMQGLSVSSDFPSNGGSVLHRMWTNSTAHAAGLQSSPQAYAPPLQSGYPYQHGQPHAYDESVNQVISTGMPPPPPMAGPHHLPSSMTPPAQLSLPPPDSSSMTTYATTPQGQGNYTLDPSRPNRYGASASISHEFPRHMPAHGSPRRHSTFEPGAPPSSDMSAPMTLGPIAESRTGAAGGTGYLSQQSHYFLPQRSAAPLAGQDGHIFPEHRSSKGADEAADGETAPQEYALDDGSESWTFEPVDGTQDQQYFGEQSNGAAGPWNGKWNGKWNGSSSGMSR
ncbi:hypothetical protein RJ55_01224 [Drechmeria coniospora]|nr:hypothetical protein RJ55_01224 [Drechmeria coniospora]